MRLRLNLNEIKFWNNKMGVELMEKEFYEKNSLRKCKWRSIKMELNKKSINEDGICKENGTFNVKNFEWEKL